MDKIFVVAIISTIVPLAVPFFLKYRNIYFLSNLIVLAGLVIAVSAHSSSHVRFEDYTNNEINIERAEFDDKEKRLVIFAEGQTFLLSSQNLSAADIAVIVEGAPKLTGNSAIWLEPDSNFVTGLNSQNLSIDPRVYAEREASLYLRLRNVGAVISIFGIFLGLFNYFTRSVNTDITQLTRKY